MHTFVLHVNFLFLMCYICALWIWLFIRTSINHLNFLHAYLVDKQLKNVLFTGFSR